MENRAGEASRERRVIGIHQRIVSDANCGGYTRSRLYTTSTPMLLAVPFTDCTAASSVKQFRSGILILAISSTCFSVILPTFVLCGSAEPFAKFTARLMRTGTGGVLVMKVKERSE